MLKDGAIQKSGRDPDGAQRPNHLEMNCRNRRHRQRDMRMIETAAGNDGNGTGVIDLASIIVDGLMPVWRNAERERPEECRTEQSG